ncbi:uncharacterized protein LOC128391599 [Panonychus citri]|uniref:uncharacterized protein LOC128391599 n=1 Tax=Panonychus citri TaxID=50023 RepID=UPI002307BEDF|nr:uncharacterized protein LOC128391599 [Panonychus citri]
MSQLIISLLMVLTIGTTVTLSIKIECGNSIDAAFWAHDLNKPNMVNVFSGPNFYVWNISNNTIESKHPTNETWTNLPANVDAACSFYFHSSLFHIFLKGDHYWLYRNYELRSTDTLLKLFSEAVPREPDCFTCDVLDNDFIGFTTIGRNSLGSRACKASFDGTRFVERECTFKTEGTDDNFKVAYKKAGYCKALATNFNPTGRDYIYFGSEKVAIGMKMDVRIESLEALVDCKNLLSAISDPTIMGIIALISLIVLLICIVCVACVCKHCGKKYETDSEGDFTEKPATAPSIAAAAESNET